jgi:deoxyadenosine/deoxycytidine kinase
MPKQIIFIEGNIGSGKSTLLKNIVSKRGGITILPEPIEEWNSYGMNGKTILELYYEDPQKYAALFQNIVVQSKMRLLIDILMSESKTSCDDANTVYVMERSYFSDYHVFAKMLHAQGHIDAITLEYFKRWMELCHATLLNAGVKVNVVWVDTDVNTCLTRIQSRRREGENGIDASYLEAIQQHYNEWLGDTQNASYVARINGAEEENKLCIDGLNAIQDYTIAA